MQNSKFKSSWIKQFGTAETLVDVVRLSRSAATTACVKSMAGTEIPARYKVKHKREIAEACSARDAEIRRLRKLLSDAGISHD